MSVRNVTVNMPDELVARIRRFQDKQAIKHFAEAVQVYIQHLEDKAYPIVAVKSKLLDSRISYESYRIRDWGLRQKNRHPGRNSPVGGGNENSG